MKVGIMQPYFFPYIGYFQLIQHTDLFVLLDDVQYIRHGWISRNRILKQDNEWQYITVPLSKHSKDTLIRDIQSHENEEWKHKIIRQLLHYKKKAPYYSKVIEILNEALYNTSNKISKLNKASIEYVCDYLGMEAKILLSSEQSFNYEKVIKPGDWALEISKQIDAQSYLNPIGGIDIFDLQKFKENNIEINFHKCTDISYSQRRKEFKEIGLSIIDVLMFNSVKEVRELLTRCDIIQGK